MEPEFFPEGIEGIVFYDGECGLCGRSVQWLLSKDRGRKLAFSPLQGELSKSLGLDLPRGGQGYESMVLVRKTLDTDGRCKMDTHSGAVLGCCSLLPQPWRLFSVARWVPRCIRDGIYRFVARRRLLWFGPARACQLPSPEDRYRFLP